MNILSVRYSINRKKEFQIKTTIFERNNEILVSKEPYTSEAINHIENIYFNYDLLSKTKLNHVIPTLYENKITFPFIEGENFASELIGYILDGNVKEFKEKLLWYKSILLNQELVPFYQVSEFKKIFGDRPLLNGMPSLKISNIDLNFENIIIPKDGSLVVIDYEWVFKFPIPAEYILYRVISIFMSKFSIYVTNLINLEEIFELIDLDFKKIELYKDMEQAFVEYVGGENSVKFKKQYYKQRTSKDDIELMQSKLLTEYNKKDTLQVFWDLNRGLNEQDSKSLEIQNNNNINHYELELPTNSLARIRIDPGFLQTYGEMKITLSYDQKETDLTNSVTFSDGILLIEKKEYLKFINFTTDPQIIIENDTLLKVGKKKLKIEFYYNSYTENYTEKLLEEYKKIAKIHSIQQEKMRIIINNLQGVLLENKNLSKKNEECREMLELQNKKMIRITDIYQKTISTKGWKTLNFIRKMKFW